MPRREEKPVRKQLGDDPYAFEETHPSYGVLEVSRRSGLYGPMCGSVLPHHDGVVHFTIKRATRVHELHYDRFHGREVLFAFQVTHAQFVEIMAQMNRANGVPITLDYVAAPGGGLKEVPNITWGHEDGTEASEALKAAKSFGNRLAMAAAKTYDEVEDRLTAAGVPKKKQKDILEPLNHLINELGPNLAFAGDMLSEASDKIVAAARTEVDAAVSTVIRSLGLQKLEELKALGVSEENANKYAAIETADQIIEVGTNWTNEGDEP